MTKEFLEQCLAEGMSLEAIAERVGRHPSTVSYHLKKHGLLPVGHEIHAPNRKMDPNRLAELIEAGATIREAASALNVSYSTTRYWMKRLGLESAQARQRRESQADRENPEPMGVVRECPTHGETTFVRRPDGGYRCGRCRVRAVSKWRQGVKRQLVEEAGGCCVICSYDRCIAALHFHHVDPMTKSFSISREGTIRSIEELRAEAEKCVLLCANCHAEVEAGKRTIPPEKLPLRFREAGAAA